MDSEAHLTTKRAVVHRHNAATRERRAAGRTSREIPVAGGNPCRCRWCTQCVRLVFDKVREGLGR